jgi:hypothetical protein
MSDSHPSSIPLVAPGLLRALPIGVALGLLGWASVAALAYGLYLLAP